MAIAARFLAPALLVVALSACGEKDEPVEAPPERRDPPAEPPAGWRSVADARAGFTVSVPPGWSARPDRAGMRISSGDRFVGVSIQADRSEAGRNTPAADYVTETIGRIPGYRDLVATVTGDVAGSPYGSARADGTGIRSGTTRRQLVTVAALQPSARVTYAAVAFRDATRTTGRDAERIDRVLASIRAGAPRRTG